ncbi:MAG: crossover junction endodeoxyribonuclease RuvC [Burkholderiaceae bacterium]|nr:crossover junction endodeoxyribonuclease RuvC [Burkholderiaceae bacterium]
MRILGIDPGLRLTGFGVIDAQGRHLRYVASGVIRIPPGTLPPRLKAIHDGVAEVIAEYRPGLAAAEIVFVNVNPQSTLQLGQARGAAITTLVTHGLDVHEYTALQIKQAVVGYGRAAKQQVQAMVQHLLRLPGLPSADAADALACAICHAHAATMTIATRSAGMRGGRLR